MLEINHHGAVSFCAVLPHEHNAQNTWLFPLLPVSDEEPWNKLKN
jgi:hypothetical protein